MYLYRHMCFFTRKTFFFVIIVINMSFTVIIITHRRPQDFFPGVGNKGV